MFNQYNRDLKSWVGGIRKYLKLVCTNVVDFEFRRSTNLKSYYILFLDISRAWVISVEVYRWCGISRNYLVNCTRLTLIKWKTIPFFYYSSRDKNWFFFYSDKKWILFNGYESIYTHSLWPNKSKFLHQ